MSLVAPAGFGSRDQAAPCQASASAVAGPLAGAREPTATQSAAPAHATAAKALVAAPAGSAGCCKNHRVPFQCWASSPLPAVPTASQLRAKGQDTDVSEFGSAPAASPATGNPVQPAPFHRSASVGEPPAAGVTPPTAVHQVADRQDTPPNPPPDAGFVGLRVQAVPSHTDVWAPSAIRQNDADGQDTVPGGSPSPKLIAAGSVWTVQLLPFHRSATGTVRSVVSV